MLFEPLHLPTLLIVTAVVVAFTGVVLLLLTRGRHASRAMAFWGNAMLAGAAGLLLLAAGDVPAPTGVAGTTLILLGTALSWTAARVFIGTRPWVGVLLAGPAAWLLWAVLPVGTDAAMLTVMAQVIGATYVAAAAAEMWRGRAEQLRSRNLAVVLLGVHAGVHLLRALSIVTDTPGPELAPGAATVATVLMFEALLHTVGLAFVLLALMKERAELQSTEQLRILALMDGLTGLGNRRQFDTALAREHGRAQRDHTSLALLMLDADHFKAFNDTYGHQAGDDCLRAVAGALQAAVHRPGDMAVRYGGEEFAVLLPHTDEAGAVVVADGIHARVAEIGTVHAGSPHGFVSVSIGAAVLRPTLETEADDLVRAADRALYAAKAGGRRRTEVADAGQPTQTRRTLAVGARRA